MTEHYGSNLNSFLRAHIHTEPETSKLAEHCLSGDYQALHPRAWPFPGVPQLFQNLDEGVHSGTPLGRSRVTGERLDLWSVVSGGRSHLLAFITQTRKRMIRLLKEEGAIALRRTIDDWTTRIHELARQIDTEFLVAKHRTTKEVEPSRTSVRPNPRIAACFDLSNEEKTDRLRETVHLLACFREIMHHRPGSQVKDILPDHAITGKSLWRLGSNISSSVSREASYPKRKGYGYLRPLTRPSVRICVSLPSWGYNCGILCFPVDATIDQAELVFELYYADLKQRADDLCHTHAVLYFRAMMAELVVHEWDIFGQVEDLSESDVRRWYEREIDDGRKRVENVAALLTAAEEYLTSSANIDECWRCSKGSWVPNVAGLYRTILRNKRNVLQTSHRYGGEVITEQAFRRYVTEKFPAHHVDDLREEVGLSSGSPN